MPFWQFFRQGQDGRELLVRSSGIPPKISKILFALGSDEFLAMLEGKISDPIFLRFNLVKCEQCEMRTNSDFSGSENVQKNFQCNFCHQWRFGFISKSFYQTPLT